MKVVGHEDEPVSSFIQLRSVVDSPQIYDAGLDIWTQQSEVTLDFAKVKTNLLSTFELIVCYTYAGYTNLADLCDTQTTIPVINAEGQCFNAD